MWFLELLNLFSGMSEAEIEALSREMREREHRRGETILSPDSPCDLIYVVRSGSVRVYQIGPGGREVTTAILRQGGLFGTSALIGTGEQQSFAEMLEGGVICEMNADEFLRIVTSNPARAQQLILRLAGQFRQLERQLANLLEADLRARLAHTLVLLAEEHGGEVPAGLTHSQLARLAGTTRETVTRTLAELARQGFVELGYRRVSIPNLDALRRLAEGHGRGGTEL